MFGLSFVDYKFYRRFAWMAYLLIILLLIAVLLFGKNLQGGQRWLKIGPLQFQPSELAKFIIVICMAKYMTDHHEDMPSFVRGFLPMAALLVVPAVLIYFQPNVSMLIILCIVFAIMLLSEEQALVSSALRHSSAVLQLVCFCLQHHIAKAV